MGGDGWMTMRAAWDRALYGPGGFYRAERPADHFRTSAQVSTDFAAAALSIARDHGAETVVDVGAGAGELLSAIRGHDADIGLVGVDLRPRPLGLAPSIGWRLADGDAGHSTAIVADVATGPTLLIANELLDNVPAEVVELTDDGLREVEVDGDLDRERLGGPPEPAATAWVERWWPVDVPGQRVVVGMERDRAWAQLCESVPDGVCVAIDYGHVLSDRPWTETAVSYRRGRSSTARFDRRHDVAAGVAVDAVAAAVGGRLARQGDRLSALLPASSRPSIGLARSDPAAYLRALSANGDWRELTDADSLGGFWWIETLRGRHRAPATMGAESEVAR